MSLSNNQNFQIHQLLKTKILEKLNKYSRETVSMPFHVRLLGYDRMAIYSFVQSINTTLGTSIFEQTAKIVAEPHFDCAQSHYKLEGYFTDAAKIASNKLIAGLRSVKQKANVQNENLLIRQASFTGETTDKRKSIVDLYLKKSNTEYFIELKTVKPNIDVFEKTKEKLLLWKSLRYSTRENLDIKAFVAFPYNPEAPKPYARWTLQGMFDLDNEVKVEDEFWDMLGGKGTFKELLSVFEQTGIELCPYIDNKFKDLREK